MFYFRLVKRLNVLQGMWQICPFFIQNVEGKFSLLSTYQVS